MNKNKKKRSDRRNQCARWL